MYHFLKLFSNKPIGIHVSYFYSKLIHPNADSTQVCVWVSECFYAKCFCAVCERDDTHI